MNRIAFVVVSLVAAGALAQGTSPPPEHLRGDVTALDGETMTLKTRDGKIEKLKLASDLKVAVAEKGDMGDVRDGAFVGTTAVPQSDGTLRAIEVHVFPEAMRGTGEGHRPWDLRPGSSMTNATVSRAEASSSKSPSTMTNATVAKSAGRKLTLHYKDGEKTVLVPSNAKIVKLEPGDRSQLKPGAHVFAIAVRQPDGTLQAQRITVGKGSVVPPM